MLAHYECTNGYACTDVFSALGHILQYSLVNYILNENSINKIDSLVFIYIYLYIFLNLNSFIDAFSLTICVMIYLKTKSKYLFIDNYL